VTILYGGLQDLCDRHEKGLLTEHQRAIQKMGQYKKKKMSATVQSGSGEVKMFYCLQIHAYRSM
jgi:hypothetical protein